MSEGLHWLAQSRAIIIIHQETEVNQKSTLLRCHCSLSKDHVSFFHVNMCLAVVRFRYILITITTA